VKLVILISVLPEEKKLVVESGVSLRLLDIGQLREHTQIPIP